MTVGSPNGGGRKADAQAGNAAQGNATTIGGVQRKLRQLFDGLLVAVTKRNTNLDLAGLAPKLAQVSSAHGKADRIGNFAGRESDLGCTNAIDNDLHLAIAGSAVRAHVLQSIDACENAADVYRNVVQPARRLAGDLQTESVATTLLVEFETGCANRDDRQVLLDLRNDLRGRAGRLGVVGKQKDGSCIGLLVEAVDRVEFQPVTVGQQVGFDAIDRGLDAIERMLTFDPVVQVKPSTVLLRERVEVDHFECERSDADRAGQHDQSERLPGANQYPVERGCVTPG